MNSIIFWKPAVEVLILWFVIYHIMLFFEGTRAVQVLRGIIIILVAFFLFQKLNLTILEWLVTKLFGISIIALLVIFQPEIRQGLAHLGQRHLFATTLRDEEWNLMLNEIAKAVENLSRDQIGALLAIEKLDPLSSYIESGVVIDARVSSEMIENIFTPKSLLHDGGLIIQQGRVAAAGCFFPLSENQELSRVFGTRHRAALGLSEDTDAIIIVVSEERQDISLVYRGRLYKDLNRQELLSRINELMKLKKEEEKEKNA